MGTRVPTWVRVGVVATLAVPQLIIGLWAMVAPERWFDTFPGFAPHLVAAAPPYNAHLVSDVGAAFFATGVALLVAAAWATRPAIWTALVAYVAFTAPHALYHATHPADALSGVADVGNVLLLVSSVVLAFVYAWGAATPATARIERRDDEVLVSAR
jgi:hypothetical protein